MQRGTEYAWPLGERVRTKVGYAHRALCAAREIPRLSDVSMRYVALADVTNDDQYKFKAPVTIFYSVCSKVFLDTRGKGIESLSQSLIDIIVNSFPRVHCKQRYEKMGDKI